MTNNGKKISIIIPFYNGNEYLERLFFSVKKVKNLLKNEAELEVIIVNDSPAIEVMLPINIDMELNIRIISNPVNMGIQKSRVNGLKESKGDWVLFLDQDDELLEEGFKQQIRLTDTADVVVGNGIYMLGDMKSKIYANKRAMDYLIEKNNFIKIRNLIPSPGECLIKKSRIPDIWLNNTLKINGADDWLLWILLFENNCVFKCNSELVYIHNDSQGKNLSADLGKMKKSSVEMANVIEQESALTKKELKELKRAIEFKYIYDTKKISGIKAIKYMDVFWNNIVYKTKLRYMETH